VKTMTVNEAAKLVKAKSAPAISLYLATDVPDKDSTTRLRLNLQRLYKTAEALIVRTYDFKTRERLLQPLKKALSAVGLRRAKGGIGIYHNEHFTGIVKLPTITSDLAVAAESFHIKPVLRCVQSRRNYYLLALKRKHAELLLVTADGTKQVERIGLKLPHDRQLPTERGNKHWLGDGVKIRRQKDLKESMEQLNRQLESNWHRERIPLVLAGSQHQQEAFRAVCTHLNLLERGISGAVDDFDTEALTNLSLNTMESYFDELDNRSVVAFRKAEASGLAITNLAEIARAAARGQIQSLLIAEDRHVWGHLDKETGSIQVIDQPGQTPADDLLDDLAELTLNKGGAVTVLPSVRMPKSQLIAAVLRWNETPVALPAARLMTRESGTLRRRHRDELRA
jgi:hypothetical protein